MSKLKCKRPELAALAIFLVTYVIVLASHEPWLDEAQAWLIARYASLPDILFEIPHYEGHPPLWHLLLAIPARLGVPYELGLKTVNAVFIVAAVVLILFRAPFPRFARLLLPFSYFIFYQYGVISRPYSVMLLAFVLAALAFPGKNEHPWRFVGALALLCLSSAYGILLAGGITLAWLMDLGPNYFKQMFHDKRTPALVALLAVALSLIVAIVPRSDAYAISIEAQNSALYGFGYIFLMGPAEGFCFNAYKQDSFLLNYTFEPTTYLSGILFGCVFWAVILFFTKKGRWKYCLLPYLLFSVFASVVYICRHHIGIAYLFFLFFVWTNLDTKYVCQQWKRLCGLQPLSKKKEKELTIIMQCVVCILLCVPVVWTAISGIADVLLPYNWGRDAANFIQEYGLENAICATAWNEIKDNNGKIENLNTEGSTMGIQLYPYFAEWSAINQYGITTYASNRLVTEEENQQTLAEWRQLPQPEVVIGSADLTLINEDWDLMSDYAPVYQMVSRMIWKDNIAQSKSYIFVRRDLLDQYGLQEIEYEGYYAVE